MGLRGRANKGGFMTYHQHRLRDTRKRTKYMNTHYDIQGMTYKGGLVILLEKIRDID